MTLALCGYQVLTGEPADDSSKYAKQSWRARAQKVGAEGAITFEPFDAEQMPFDLVRTSHPDHPDPADPTPFVPRTFALEKTPTEKFDVYVIRHAAG